MSASDLEKRELPWPQRLARHSPHLALIVLALTLLVYPTILNPGMPLVLAGLFLLVTGALRISAGSGKYYHPVQEISVLLLLWLGLSLVVNGVDYYFGEKSLFTFAGGVGFFVSVQLGIRRGSQMRTLCYLFVAFMVMVSVFAWGEAIPVALSTGEFQYLKGRFANPDTFSVLPLLGLLVGCGLAERMPKKLLMPFCGLLSFLMLTVITTGCRAALLGLVAGSVIFGTLISSYQKKKLDQTRFLVTIPLLLILILLPLSAFNFSVLQKYAKTFDGNNLAHEGTRIEVNYYGWKAVALNPVLGGGPGSFGFIYQGVRPPGHDHLYVDIAHNDFIEMAVESGVVGLALWLVLIGLSATKLFLCVKKGKRGFLAAGLLAAVAAVSVFSLVNFVLPERPVLWTFLFLLGMGASMPSTRIRYTEKPVVRYAGGLILILFGLISIPFGWKAWQADRELYLAGLSSEALLKEEAVGHLELAVKLMPGRASLYVRLSRLSRTLATLSGESKWLKKERESLIKATEASPYYVSPLVGLSEHYQRARGFANAEKYLALAKERDPHRPDLIQKTVSLMVRKGELESAARLLFSVVDKPGHLNYRQLKGLLLTIGYRDLTKLDVLLKEPSLRDAVWFSSLVTELSEKAVSDEQWEVADSFVRVALKEQPEDLCLKILSAQIRGELVGERAEFEALAECVEDGESQRGECAKRVVSRYLTLLQKFEGPPALRRYLTRQILLFPRVFEYRLRLSEILEDQGEYRAAQQILREGLDQASPTAEVNYRLGRLYEKTKSTQLATGYYREALKLDPRHSTAAARLKALLK